FFAPRSSRPATEDHTQRQNRGIKTARRGPADRSFRAPRASEPARDQPRRKAGALRRSDRRENACSAFRDLLRQQCERRKPAARCQTARAYCRRPVPRHCRLSRQLAQPAPEEAEAGQRKSPRHVAWTCDICSRNRAKPSVGNVWKQELTVLSFSRSSLAETGRVR